jgi:hypothetical protein
MFALAFLVSIHSAGHGVSPKPVPPPVALAAFSDASAWHCGAPRAIEQGVGTVRVCERVRP